MAESDCKFGFRVVEWQYTDKGSKILRRLICKYQIGTRVNGSSNWTANTVPADEGRR